MEKKKFDVKKIGTVLFALFLGVLATFFGSVSAGAALFLIIGFVLGKYTEKMLAAIRDYRLSLKLDRVHWSQVEYDAMKKELEVLRATVRNQAVYAAMGAPHRPGGVEAPPAMGQPLSVVDESVYMR